MRQHVKPVGCDSRHMPDSVQITSSLVGAPPRPFRHSAGPPLCPDEAFQRAAAVGRRGASSLCLKPRETRHLVCLRKTVQHESGTSALLPLKGPRRKMPTTSSRDGANRLHIGWGHDARRRRSAALLRGQRRSCIFKHSGAARQRRGGCPHPRSHHRSYSKNKRSCSRHSETI
jgi:hypothetical protein